MPLTPFADNPVGSFPSIVVLWEREEPNARHSVVKLLLRDSGQHLMQFAYKPAKLPKQWVQLRQKHRLSKAQSIPSPPRPSQTLCQTGFLFVIRRGHCSHAEESRDGQTKSSRSQFTLDILFLFCSLSAFKGWEPWPWTIVTLDVQEAASGYRRQVRCRP